MQWKPGSECGRRRGAWCGRGSSGLHTVDQDLFSACRHSQVACAVNFLSYFCNVVRASFRWRRYWVPAIDLEAMVLLESVVTGFTRIVVGRVSLPVSFGDGRLSRLGSVAAPALPIPRTASDLRVLFVFVDYGVAHVGQVRSLFQRVDGVVRQE